MRSEFVSFAVFAAYLVTTGLASAAALSRHVRTRAVTRTAHLAKDVCAILQRYAVSHPVLTYYMDVPPGDWHCDVLFGARLWWRMHRRRAVRRVRRSGRGLLRQADRELRD